MCKRQVLQQSWAQCFVVKNTQKLGTAFFIEQIQWLLLNWVLVSEKNSEKGKLVERLPLIWVACFMCKYKTLHSGQLLQEHLSLLEN